MERPTASRKMSRINWKERERGHLSPENSDLELLGEKSHINSTKIPASMPQRANFLLRGVMCMLMLWWKKKLDDCDSSLLERAQ